MSVAVSCNLSDGVILGVDSAVTVSTVDGGVARVYENAEKLFQLNDLPIGIATYGLGSIANRSIGSYIRQFSVEKKSLISTHKVGEVCEELRTFFCDIYKKNVEPVLESKHSKPFAEIEGADIPKLGLVVGGFSPGEYLSEVWAINVPDNSTVNSSLNRRVQGDFGTNWFATYEPIRRYMKGYEPNLIRSLLEFVIRTKGVLTPSEMEEFNSIVNGHEYPIPFPAMPMEEGVAHTRFLVELVVNHYRFVVGAPIVGGKIQIGKVTYNGEEFKIL